MMCLIQEFNCVQYDVVIAGRPTLGDHRYRKTNSRTACVS
uniref:Uncharacterized protein n=1 Tax=Anguilla anguilla TaxID=7936 RepID=A0A0E9SLV2_ANGAN